MLSPVEEIKSRLDIADVIGHYIKLQKAGANYRALCPFHHEKTPSFFVSPSRQIWHCFGGCSAGGDIFTFVMRIEGVEFPEALKILADKAGVKLKREDPALASERNKCYEILEEAASLYETELWNTETGNAVRAYLTGRGLKEETMKEFRLGYASQEWRKVFTHLTELGYKKDDVERAGLIIKATSDQQPPVIKYYDRFRGRIMFPVVGLNGKVIGFTGRIFEDAQRSSEPQKEVAKYVNTPQTSVYDKGRVLYGLQKSGLEIRKHDACVVVEGNMDFLMSWQAGVKNVVASSGTALTPWQLRMIKRYTENIIFAFDRDAAGAEATKRGIENAEALGFTIKVIPASAAKDAADIIREDPQEWSRILSRAHSLYDFYFEHVFSAHDPVSVEGKKKITKILLPVLARIPNKVEQAHWVSRLASRLRVPESFLFEEFAKLPPAREENTNLYEDVVLPDAPPQKKTRRDILEERLLIIFSRHPEKQSEFFSEGSDNTFLSEDTKRMMAFLVERGAAGIEESEAMPERLKELVKYFDLYSEFEKDGAESGEEFEICVKELQILYAKERLEMLALLIKEAEEAANEDRMHELLEEFKETSENLHRLYASLPR